MRPHTIASLALLGTATHAAAAAVPSSEPTFTWHATRASIESVNNGPTVYQLRLAGEGESLECYTQNKVKSQDCPGANGPAVFSKRPCNSNVDTNFSWEFLSTDQPIPGGEKQWYYRFTYRRPGKKTLYGCSYKFLASDNSCVGPPGHGEILNIPRSFNITPALDGNCVTK